MSILRAAEGPERIHVFGVPTMKAEAAHLMSRDMSIFMPLTALVLVVVLYLAFRTVRGVLVPLATVGIGLVWTVGLMGAVGAPLDAVGLVLPSLLLAIGAAYATHVVARFADLEAPTANRADVARRTILHLGAPVIVTGLTTVAGFASLIVYRVASIQRLGVFLTFGIAALFVLALTFTAAVLAILPARPARDRDTVRQWPRLRAALDAIVRFDVRRRHAVLAAAALLAIVLAWWIPDVRVDTDTSKYFPEDSPVALARDEVERRLGGGVSFLVVVDGPEPGSVTRLEPLRRIAELQAFVDAIPGVVAAHSIVDVVEVVHRALVGGEGARLGLPESEEAIAQELLLVPPEAVDSFLAPDGRR
ncbi:MAG: efflux RND transporter permease subunit, partial [Candidatus Binatia bacterium]